MYPIDANSAIKQSVYISISLACFSFVVWQSVQCIGKYIEKPQGTKLSLLRTSEIHQFPAITICAWNMTDQHDRDYLKRCGLRYNNIFS